MFPIVGCETLRLGSLFYSMHLPLHGAESLPGVSSQSVSVQWMNEMASSLPSKAVVLWSDCLVFCDYGFTVSALWCPFATPTVLLGFLSPWTWGLSSRLPQQSTATAPYLGRGEGRLRGATPCPRSGVAAERSYPTSKAAARAPEGWEELLYIHAIILMTEIWNQKIFCNICWCWAKL